MNFSSIFAKNGQSNLVLVLESKALYYNDDEGDNDDEGGNEIGNC